MKLLQPKTHVSANGCLSSFVSLRLCSELATGPGELDGGGEEAGKMHSRAQAANLLHVNVSPPCVSPLWGLTLRNVAHRLAHSTQRPFVPLCCVVSQGSNSVDLTGVCVIFMYTERERDRDFFFL